MSSQVTVHIERAGMSALAQDFGRNGHQQSGVPVGGVLDRKSASTANWLVGNPAGSAVLEIALLGPTLRFSGPCQIALTGADLSANIDGKPLPRYTSVQVQEQSVLRFGKNNGGCRAYLAIGGNWQVREWLGSVSATPYAPELTPDSDLQNVQRILINDTKRLEDRTWSKPLPRHMGNYVVRVLPGPEFQSFATEAIAAFLNQAFEVTPAMNRMGIVLHGSLPGHNPEKEIISSGIVPGTIQVTNNGQPVVLLADAQTSGGYPRIANIITADLPILGQVVPGNTVAFVLVSSEQAQKATLSFLEELKM